MKRDIKITIVDETPKETIVIVSKDLSYLELTKFYQEQQKFINKDSREIENVIDSIVCEKLAEYGLLPTSTDKSALKGVFDTLKSKYHKEIKIVDLYDGIKGEKIVSKLNGRTTIIDKYRVIQCAMAIKEIDYD